MDAKPISKSSKKSQSSNHRKKKKQRKKDGVGRGSGLSPGTGGSSQRERVVGGRVDHRDGPGKGANDSAADSDSKDSGLEVDCRPQTERPIPEETGKPFLSARALSSLSMDRQPTAKKVNSVVSVKQDAKSDRSGGRSVKQQQTYKQATDTGGLSEKKNVLKARQSMPNLSSSNTNEAFNRKTEYAVSGRSSSHTENTNGLTIKTDSLRWENSLDDSEEEAERMQIYKLNRRKRYIAASNEKYEDWLSSCSNTSLSGSSGSNRARRSGSEAESGMLSNNVMPSHRGNSLSVGTAYNEFSQMVINTHGQPNTNQRILLNC